MKQLRETADFDYGYRDPKQRTIDTRPGNTAFSDRGKADIKVRRNDPRFGDNPLDNPLSDQSDNRVLILDDVDEGQIDRLHQMLTNAGISDQELRGGINLKRDKKVKLAASFGVSPMTIDSYLNVIKQRVNNQERDDMENMLSEAYYAMMNEDKEDDSEVDDEEAGQPDRPFEGRYSYEPDSLGSMTVRDSTTGKSRFIQGSEANRIQSQLKAAPDAEDAILGPLLEKLHDSPSNFADEINANSGSYNFFWQVGEQHGTGTAMFHAGKKPDVRVVSVRDANGNRMDADPGMQRELLRQAYEFIDQA